MKRIGTAIVLAAGGSTRMGSPKALLRLHGSPLVALHCAALARGARRIVVVVGAGAEAVRAAVPAGVETVENPAWATTWPADSLRCAVVAAGVRGRAIVTPVDVPPVPPGTLAALLDGPAPAVPVDPQGRRGHPVLVDARRIAWLRTHPAPAGLDTWLTGVREVPVADPLAAVDFDDADAWARFLAKADG